MKNYYVGFLRKEFTFIIRKSEYQVFQCFLENFLDKSDATLFLRLLPASPTLSHY